MAMASRTAVLLMILSGCVGSGSAFVLQGPRAAATPFSNRNVKSRMSGASSMEGPDAAEVDKVLKVATAAAKAAGEVLRKELGGDVVETKFNTKDLLTQADGLCQEVIEKKISEAFPSHSILGEESVEPGMEASSKALQGKINDEWLWILDPIDGTTNFVHSIPLCGVSIGVAHKGKHTVGVVYDPFRDELFSAKKGGGAFLNGNAISVDSVTDLSDAVVAGGSPPNQLAVKPALRGIEALAQHVRTMRLLGSATIMYTWVACGRLSAYFEPDLNSWDSAAGALLVEEAGGNVTDLRSMKPFNLASRAILASSPGVHENIRRRLMQARACVCDAPVDLALMINRRHPDVYQRQHSAYATGHTRIGIANMVSGRRASGKHSTKLASAPAEFKEAEAPLAEYVGVRVDRKGPVVQRQHQGRVKVYPEFELDGDGPDGPGMALAPNRRGPMYQRQHEGRIAFYPETEDQGEWAWGPGDGVALAVDQRGPNYMRQHEGRIALYPWEHYGENAEGPGLALPVDQRGPMYLRKFDVRIPFPALVEGEVDPLWGPGDGVALPVDMRGVPSLRQHEGAIRYYPQMDVGDYQDGAGMALPCDRRGPGYQGQHQGRIKESPVRADLEPVLVGPGTPLDVDMRGPDYQRQHEGRVALSSDKYEGGDEGYNPGLGLRVDMRGPDYQRQHEGVRVKESYVGLGGDGEGQLALKVNRRQPAKQGQHTEKTAAQATAPPRAATKEAPAAAEEPAKEEKPAAETAAPPAAEGPPVDALLNVLTVDHSHEKQTVYERAR